MACSMSIHVEVSPYSSPRVAVHDFKPGRVAIHNPHNVGGSEYVIIANDAPNYDKDPHATLFMSVEALRLLHQKLTTLLNDYDSAAAVEVLAGAD